MSNIHILGVKYDRIYAGACCPPGFEEDLLVILLSQSTFFEGTPDHTFLWEICFHIFLRSGNANSWGYFGDAYGI